MQGPFSGMEVGYADAISGVIDGQHFHTHGMKEPYYTMMFMTTYGTMERSDKERGMSTGKQCSSSI